MAKKLVCGVGLNDAGYEINKFKQIEGKKIQIFACPYYKRWSQMLRRCYSKAWHLDRPDCSGNSVCDEWLTFSNFKSWMEKQDWQGKELDKDILIKGNRMYSPSTCVFVDSDLNNFFRTTYINNQGKNGTSWNKKHNKFHAQINNPITKKQEHLGCFDSQLDAHNAWKKRKIELAAMLAYTQEDERIIEILLTRFSI